MEKKVAGQKRVFVVFEERMQTHPIITIFMEMLARIPKVAFIIGLAVLSTLSTQTRQADAFRYWGVFNVLLSLVSISKNITLGWYETKQLIWHVLGHGIFLVGAVYALQTPEFTIYELFVFFISTALILTQYPSTRMNEDRYKDP